MEFKKLSAVEMVETVDQAATVLIEKDGVIKRAPKNEIGTQADWSETDSSSPAFIKNKPVEEYDLDVSVTASYSDDDDEYMFESNINSGSFDKVKNKILKNEYPNIKIQFNCISNNGCPEMFVESPVVYYTSYMPEGFWGVDSNPELCVLLYHSYWADSMMETDIMSDGYIDTGLY
jgi:hypothetical protein